MIQGNINCALMNITSKDFKWPLCIDKSIQFKKGLKAQSILDDLVDSIFLLFILS